VAGVAVEIAMRARQRIFCLDVVVEAPPLPADGVMAKPATRTKATLVMVVAMTCDASGRRILEIRRSVTPLASHLGVLSGKREFGQVMIERRRSPPGDLRMTLLAFGTELSFVPVVFLVTGDAGRRQFIAIEITCMA
jgi:hypothetical protein